MPTAGANGARRHQRGSAAMVWSSQETAPSCRDFRGTRRQRPRHWLPRRLDLPSGLRRPPTTNEHTRREAGPQSHGTHWVSRVAEWSRALAFWDGTRWVPDAAPIDPQPHPTWRDWIATATMILVSAMFVVPFTGAFAAGNPASLSLSPADGPAGTHVIVKGSGFSTKTKVTVTWDASSQGMPATVVTGRGAFKIDFVVPAGSVGPHTVGVVASPSGASSKAGITASSGVLATAVFQLEAPAVPDPTPPPTAAPTPRPTTQPT